MGAPDTTPEKIAESLGAFIDANHQEQVQFLADLVRVPTDNPPGDCAPHAERTAGLLEKIGLTVERHPVPTAEARACSMLSATNLVVRRRFGDGIDSPSVVVGLIAGGVNTNVVPDLVTLRIDRRMIPEEDAGAVEAELAALIEETAARIPGASSAVRRILLARPLVPLPGIDKIADPLVRHASRVMGEEITAGGV